MTKTLYENRTKAISGAIGAVAGYWLVSQSRKNKYKTWKKIAGGIIGTTLGVEIAKIIINHKKKEEKKSKVLPVISKYETQPAPEPMPTFNSNSEFWDFMSGITEGIDNIVTTFVSVLFGNDKSKIRLNNLSSYMLEALEKVAEEKIIGGMEFVAENGTTIALIAYASGNVGIGLIIDGVTVASDCTLAFIECQRTGNYSKFKKTFFANLISVAIGAGIGNKATAIYENAFKNIPDSLTKKAIDSVSNILAEYACLESGNEIKELLNTDEN